jgi:hypothetical protein
LTTYGNILYVIYVIALYYNEVIMTTRKDVEELLKKLEEKERIVNIGHLDYSLLQSSLLENYPDEASKSEYYLALPGLNLFAGMEKVLAIAQDLFKELPSVNIENMDDPSNRDRSRWQYVRISIKEPIGELSRKTAITLNPEQGPIQGFVNGKREEKNETKLYRQIFLYLYPRAGKAHYAYGEEYERRHSPSE